MKRNVEKEDLALLVKIKVMKLNTCKKVCQECPFRKDSASGWLGDHTTEQIINAINFEHLFSCHMQRGEDVNVNHKAIEEGEQHICRGFLICASKSAKMFGGNPNTGSELKRLQSSLILEDEERENIMNKWEFSKHHN